MSAAEFVYTVLLKPPILRKGANLLLQSILPETIQIKGATIHLNPSDPVISGALTLRSYEKEEIDFFIERFEPGMTFVDIGANVGLYTGLALAKAPHSRILCVEPDKNSAAFLRKTIASNSDPAGNPRVTVYNLAASDKPENIVLYKNSQNKGDNRIYADPLCDEREMVESDTLDNLCAKADIGEINFLKVDVQGAEFKAFSGAGKVLSQSPDCILMTEFWPYGLNQCGGNPEQYLALLQELGFKLYELAGKSLVEIKDFADIISRCPGRVYRNLIGYKGRYNP